MPGGEYKKPYVKPYVAYVSIVVNFLQRPAKASMLASINFAGQQ